MVEAERNKIGVRMSRVMVMFVKYACRRCRLIWQSSLYTPTLNRTLARPRITWKTQTEKKHRTDGHWSWHGRHVLSNHVRILRAQNFAQNWNFVQNWLLCAEFTRSPATMKSTARPSCLVGVLHDVSREKVC